MSELAATLTADDVTPATADDLEGMLELQAIPLDTYRHEVTFRGVIVTLSDGSPHLADIYPDDDMGKAMAMECAKALKQVYVGARASRFRRTTVEIGESVN